MNLLELNRMQKKSLELLKQTDLQISKEMMKLVEILVILMKFTSPSLP